MRERERTPLHSERRPRAATEGTPLRRSERTIRRACRRCATASRRSAGGCRAAGSPRSGGAVSSARSPSSRSTAVGSSRSRASRAGRLRARRAWASIPAHTRSSSTASMTKTKAAVPRAAPTRDRGCGRRARGRGAGHHALLRRRGRLNDVDETEALAAPEDDRSRALAELAANAASGVTPPAGLAPKRGALPPLRHERDFDRHLAVGRRLHAARRDTCGRDGRAGAGGPLE